MFETPTLGIDLGNANTRVYRRGWGLMVDEPSFVTVTAQTRRPVAVGRRAKAMLGRCHPGLLSVRPLSQGVVVDLVATQVMLRQLLAGTGVTRRFDVLISVPVGTTPVERRGVEQAAMAAGAATVTIIDEPLAAAIGAGLEIDLPVGGMLVDVGAGVTEAVVVSLGGIVSKSSSRLAGEDMDQAIVDRVLQSRDLVIGLPTAERIKVLVGATLGAARSERMSIVGIHRPSGLPRRVIVTSGEVAEAVEPVVRSIVSTVMDALQATPPELCADIDAMGMVLTGGSSNLPGLAERIASETGIETRVPPRPDGRVIEGSARCLEDRRLMRSIGH